MAFAPVYFTSLGGSVLQYGMVTTFATLISIPSTVVGAAITQRYSLKKIAVITTTLGLCISLGYYFSSSWITVSILTLIAAAGSIGSTAWQQLVADATVYKNRTAQLSLYQTLTAIPSIFCPLLGGYIIHSMGVIDGFRLGILISLAISPISMVLILRYLRENKPDNQIQNSSFHEKQKPLPSVLYHYRDFYKNMTMLPKALIPLLAAIVLVVMANSMINPYLIFYATSIAKLDSFEWGIILSSQILFANIIRTPLGMISDRFDKRKVLILSVAMTAPVPLFLIFVKSFWGILGILLAMIATGISYGPTHEALQIELTPREKRPALFAIYSVLRNLSISAGTIIGAILFTASYIVPFYGFAIVEGCAGTILAFAFLRKRVKKRSVKVTPK
jgi:DHA1 family multidrug resistance protein-like MFS transporter